MYRTQQHILGLVFAYFKQERNIYVTVDFSIFLQLKRFETTCNNYIFAVKIT